jgi:6-phosphofructokinase
MIRKLQYLGVDAVISIGGDGSQRISQQLFEKGLNIIGVPKTIDNDLAATDFTFGFQTAVNTATEAVDKLVTTAASHNRVLVLEVMGRNAGWIALNAAIAGGAEVILLDEPTAGMSKSETSRFINLIKEVTVGKTLLTVEHDMGVVFGLADKIAVVVYGEVIAFDTPEAVRSNPRVQEAYLGSHVADAQVGGH